MRTESYFRLNISPEDFLSLLSNDGAPTGRRGRISFGSKYSLMYFRFLLNRFIDACHDELTLMLLEPVLLSSPDESPFILGPCPMNLVNPFFSRRHPLYEDGKCYDLIGTCLVLPLSPTLSLCLYDPDIYRFRKKNGVVRLSSHDVDILNMIQIYNGGKTDGFVYTGDRGRIVDTILRFGGPGVRSECGMYDEYPFDTDLSCCFVRAESEEDFSSLREKKIPDFVTDFRKYSNDFIDRVNADMTKYGVEKHRRYVYAYNCLFEGQIDE